MGDLRFAPDAFIDVPKADSDRVLEKIQWLWENRRIISHHPLRYELSGLYKRVLGKYRIVYQYESKNDTMIVCLVGTRDTIYEDAAKKYRH
jgi:mRNA-degrading endonuclease RelE of RelBE toxin-antitoxin system